MRKKVVNENKRSGLGTHYKKLLRVLCLLSQSAEQTITATGEKGNPLIGGYQGWKWPTSNALFVVGAGQKNTGGTSRPCRAAKLDLTRLILPVKVKALQVGEFTGTIAGRPKGGHIRIVESKTLKELPKELKEQVKNQCYKILQALSWLGSLVSFPLPLASLFLDPLFGFIDTPLPSLA